MKLKKFFVVFRDSSCLHDKILEKLRFFETATWDLKEADEIMVLGGDGLMLSAINEYWRMGLPFCGLNFGHLGFLMNDPTEQNIEEIIHGQTHSVFPKMLEAKLTHLGGKNETVYAFNDFYFERIGTQTANIKITVGLSKEKSSRVIFDPLVCDGVIVCSQAGSTAYNASAGGVILPIETEAMVLTGICPALFHHWKTSSLPSDSRVILEPKSLHERFVRFVADGKEIPDVLCAMITYSQTKVELKFAKNKSFREKFLQMQF